jgi:hypothetical protein
MFFNNTFSPIKMDAKSFAKWQKTRQLGRTKFIWIYGVVLWGITTGVLWTMFMVAFFLWLGGADVSLSKHPLFLMTLNVIGFMYGGYFWGKMVWDVLEKAYQERVNSGSVSF